MRSLVLCAFFKTESLKFADFFELAHYTNSCESRISVNIPASSSGSTRRAYDESGKYDSYNSIKGSRYVDGGVRRTNSQPSQDFYDDGYGRSASQQSQFADDDVKTYTRKSSQPRKTPGYEDISSFSSSDRDIYSSSSRKNSKYINDYIDYE